MLEKLFVNEFAREGSPWTLSFSSPEAYTDESMVIDQETAMEILRAQSGKLNTFAQIESDKVRKFYTSNIFQRLYMAIVGHIEV